jgi:hypothetical protein
VCFSANLPGRVGICSPVPAGQTDLPGCPPPAACDGGGTCQQPVAPLPVTNVTYSFGGPGTVAVSWPLSTGAVAYRVMAKRFSDLLVLNNLIVSGPPAIFNGLPLGVPLFFSVEALGPTGLASTPIGGGVITLGP